MRNAPPFMREVGRCSPLFMRESIHCLCVEMPHFHRGFSADVIRNLGKHPADSRHYAHAAV